MLLRTEPVPFRISTVDLSLLYREQDLSAKVHVEAQSLADYEARTGLHYRTLQVWFEGVHEARCRGGNFDEMHHGDIQLEQTPADEIQHWRDTGHCPFSGLYRALEHPGLAALRAHYDPRGLRDLQLFILTGNDSYLEILATGYRYALADTLNRQDTLTIGPSAPPG
ncbi:MAG: hypothetical protein GAK31_02007 [Stenotrophomonas maltophilia]|uniref:Uncharacterized protein n=1 Tax=Stenotrophomonas maltophilia TaxID=40324 RepID=A0A7V8JLA0_STEMA|nr:MAG: hypothetical protein GAK31_02007 [Stenotrophomonas maltophilia]